MTIDEAIAKAEYIADCRERCAEHTATKKAKESISESAAESRQLAEWLKGLKMYQQRYLDALQLLKEATADFHKILPLITDCSFCSMYDKEKGECTGESALECADICAWRLYDKFLDVSF